MQASSYSCLRINYFTKPHKLSSFLVFPHHPHEISGCNAAEEKAPTSERLFCVKTLFSLPNSGESPDPPDG